MIYSQGIQITGKNLKSYKIQGYYGGNVKNIQIYNITNMYLNLEHEELFGGR